ncbi:MULTISPECIES: DUF4166 domain-containing protein [unclassified Frigoribacterium]|uniref:DUF4166 domain-containing protein n=1 Tax=unclassified Frigoribacterium TaxID=2627005 RepID=UPI0006F70BE9|nr:MULTISPECIES: DUF4166 domain-containing protein [unclassified Frigoribacterium]
MTAARSPYEAAMGDELDRLHPRLRTYFAAVPAGSVGRGRGTFAVVGTPRRWLWPALWVLGRQGVLFPVDRRDVPFRVTNRGVTDATGAVAVQAVRSFDFADGSRRMVDAITARGEVLEDRLGHRRRWSARLRATVVDGALTMSSTGTALRVGRVHVPLPRSVAPRVTLHESFDESVGRQRVSVVLDSPALGRLYEYTGHFDYEVVADHRSGGSRPDTELDPDHDPRRGPRP